MSKSVIHICCNVKALYTGEFGSVIVIKKFKIFLISKNKRGKFPLFLGISNGRYGTHLNSVSCQISYPSTFRIYLMHVQKNVRPGSSSKKKKEVKKSKRK